MKFPRFNDMYSFTKDALSEPNGTGSFSRVAAAFIVGCSLVWITYVVYETKALPDFAGVTLFMTSGSAATYGANKVAGVVSGALSPKQPVNTEPSAQKRDDNAAGDSRGFQSAQPPVQAAPLAPPAPPTMQT